MRRKLMCWKLLTAPISEVCLTKANKNQLDLLQACSIRLRLLRYQLNPWLILAIAPFKLMFSAGLQRTQTQIRYMRAISKINFTGVYGFLNDLLW